MALVLAGLTLSAPIARAQTEPGFALAPEAGWYSYQESGVRLTGPLAGVRGSWTSDTKPVFARIEAIGDAAFLDYNSTLSGSASGIWDLKGELRALGGTDVPLGHAVLTPYAGLGYRALYDLEGGAMTNMGAVGYNRLSQYLYIPLGLTLGFRVGNWKISPTVEGDYFVEGWQTSYLTDVPCGCGTTSGTFDSNITDRQHQGYGLRGEIDFETTGPWGRPISIGPFIRYWEIGQSDFASAFSNGRFVGIAFEPSNHTIEGGVNLSFKF